MTSRFIALVFLLSGCFLHHEVVATTDGGASLDAGTDAATPPPPRICEGADRFVSVEVAGDPGCALGETMIYSPRAFMDGPDLVINATVYDETLRVEYACRFTVGGLSRPVVDGFVSRFERIADAYVVTSFTHIAIRDTSLCDGPARFECPLVMEAESGGLRPMEAFGAVSMRWGETLCTGECGQLRALDFAYSAGERVDRATLHQGEINDTSTSAVRFANLRSWNSCTDEGDTITWAYWLL